MEKSRISETSKATKCFEIVENIKTLRTADPWLSLKKNPSDL